MEKRLKIEDFADVDGESFTFAERLEELGEELTTKDIWIMDGQKFKNTKEGRRLLENYALSTYGGRSREEVGLLWGFGFAAVAFGFLFFMSLESHDDGESTAWAWFLSILFLFPTVASTIAFIRVLTRR